MSGALAPISGGQQIVLFPPRSEMEQTFIAITERLWNEISPQLEEVCQGTRSRVECNEVQSREFSILQATENLVNQELVNRVLDHYFTMRPFFSANSQVVFNNGSNEPEEIVIEEISKLGANSEGSAVVELVEQNQNLDRLSERENSGDGAEEVEEALSEQQGDLAESLLRQSLMGEPEEREVVAPLVRSNSQPSAEAPSRPVQVQPVRLRPNVNRRHLSRLFIDQLNAQQTEETRRTVGKTIIDPMNIGRESYADPRGEMEIEHHRGVYGYVNQFNVVDLSRGENRVERSYIGNRNAGRANEVFIFPRPARGTEGRDYNGEAACASVSLVMVAQLLSGNPRIPVNIDTSVIQGVQLDHEARAFLGQDGGGLQIRELYAVRNRLSEGTRVNLDRVQMDENAMSSLDAPVNFGLHLLHETPDGASEEVIAEIAQQNEAIMAENEASLASAIRNLSLHSYGQNIGAVITRGGSSYALFIRVNPGGEIQEITFGEPHGAQVQGGRDVPAFMLTADTPEQMAANLRGFFRPKGTVEQNIEFENMSVDAQAVFDAQALSLVTAGILAPEAAEPIMNKIQRDSNININQDIQNLTPETLLDRNPQNEAQLADFKYNVSDALRNLRRANNGRRSLTVMNSIEMIVLRSRPVNNS